MMSEQSCYADKFSESGLHKKHKRTENLIMTIPSSYLIIYVKLQELHQTVFLGKDPPINCNAFNSSSCWVVLSYRDYSK